MSELNEPLLISYGIFIVLSFSFSLLTNFLLLKFARTLGTRNFEPSMIRWSNEVRPSLGGITFFITFLFALSAYSFIFARNDYFRNTQSIGIILSCTLGFLMGLYDDAFNTKVSLKLITQITCGLILISTGTSIRLFEYDILNYLLTMFWVVAMMNSLNMLDNMDAISTIVSGFIILTTLISLFIKGDLFNPHIILMLGIFSALAAFLVYNWHPSKMFMGDTGSQFLGVFLAATGILYFWNPIGEPGDVNVFKQLVIILILHVLLIIDTSTVFIKRTLAGGSPFVGGKDHTTHHLSYLGFKDNHVAWVFIILSSFSMFIVVFLQFWLIWSALLGIVLLLYFAVLFGALFYIANLNK